MQKTLIIGYGNPDRQDDGVAWHILSKLAARLGHPVPDSYLDEFPPTEEPPDLHFALQLMPEMADMLGDYERVCFIDAHTGSVPHDLQFISLSAHYQASPLTHHLTPESCLALADTLNGTHPEAILVSVRGYKFDFLHELSAPTAALAEQAVNRIWDWLHNPI